MDSHPGASVSASEATGTIWLSRARNSLFAKFVTSHKLLLFYLCYHTHLLNLYLQILLPDSFVASLFAKGRIHLLLLYLQKAGYICCFFICKSRIHLLLLYLQKPDTFVASLFAKAECICCFFICKYCCQIHLLLFYLRIMLPDKFVASLFVNTVARHICCQVVDHLGCSWAVFFVLYYYHVCVNWYIVPNE